MQVNMFFLLEIHTYGALFGEGGHLYYSIPHVLRAGTIKVSRPVFYTLKYVESNGILSNYMIIFRVDPINNLISTQNTTRFYVFLGTQYGSAHINRADTLEVKKGVVHR